ncbi:SEC-C metal-binding domain-containing protein [Paracoccus liaowanqingii]
MSRPELVMKADNLSHPPVRSKRPGRNDPCPCGSGRKYKQCCGKN